MKFDIKDYKFTFETDQELFDAELTGYIEAYDCVRIELKHTNGGITDFPVKSRESLKVYQDLNLYKGTHYHISNVYPTIHSYDIQDYL